MPQSKTNIISINKVTIHYNTFQTNNPSESEHTVIVEATVPIFGTCIRAAVLLDTNGSPAKYDQPFKYEGVDNVELAVRRYLDSHGETDAPSLTGLLEIALIEEAVATFRRDN